MKVNSKEVSQIQMSKLVEFKGFEGDLKLGDKITVDHFMEGENMLMFLEFLKVKVFKVLLKDMDLEVLVIQLMVNIID